MSAVRRLDLSAAKSIWRDRVHAQLVFRNLLDAPQRYHPAGVGSDLSYHVNVSVELPGRSVP